MAVRNIEQSKMTSSHGKLGRLLNSRVVPVDLGNRERAVTLIRDLLDTMSAQKLCIGLAANQIGEDLAVAVISFPGLDEEPLVLINPRVISATGKKDRKRESCMSVWGRTGEVERRTKVLVGYQDENLEPHEREFEGFVARIVEHEIDHLEGVLYTDLVPVGGMVKTDLFSDFSPNLE